MKRVVSHKNNREGWKIRFTDPLTGSRKKKTYWYKDKDQAKSAHVRFMESRQAQLEGTPDPQAWHISFSKLTADFLKQVDVSPARREDLTRWLGRNEFGIRSARDFLSLPPLNEDARKLFDAKVAYYKKKGEEPVDAERKAASYVRKCAQGPMKQLTKWCAEHQILPKDPLAYWKRLNPGRKQKPRAFTVPEFKAILDAAEELAGLRGERGSYRLAWLTLVLSGNRPSAIFNANVKDLVAYKNVGAWKIELPAGNGKKRNGEATLPWELAQDLSAAAKARKAKPDDPLLVSPQGDRIDRNNAKRQFERCMALAFVKQLWPEDTKEGVEPYDVMTLLLTGRHRGFDGPAPKLLAKKQARNLRLKLTQQIADAIEPAWSALMERRYMYRTRATHISWARGADVNRDSVHAQVGHAGVDVEEQHYLALVDPVRSSAAVWTMLSAEEIESGALKKAVGAEGFDEQGPQQGPQIPSSMTDNNPPRAGGRDQNTYENTVITGQSGVSCASNSGPAKAEVGGSNPPGYAILSTSPTRGLGKLPKKDKGPKTPDGARTGAANSGEFDRSDPSQEDLGDRLTRLAAEETYPLPPELNELIRNWAELPAHVRETILLLGKSGGVG